MISLTLTRGLSARNTSMASRMQSRWRMPSVLRVAVERTCRGSRRRRRQLQRPALTPFADRKRRVGIAPADVVEDVLKAPAVLGRGEIVTGRQFNRNLTTELHLPNPTEGSLPKPGPL